MVFYTIYVVDDEKSIREGVSYAFKKDYQIKTFATAKSAIKHIKSTHPDLILLDIGLPDMSGIEVLKEVKRSYPDVLVIMITAYEDITTVVSAMQYGAYDYVVKPLNMDSLRLHVNNALETIKLRKEVQTFQERYLAENIPFFIGESNTIQEVMDFVKKVSNSIDTPILIIGETGTGKELIAKTIHYKSPHFKGPFVSLNCAAIPKDIIESELFGYEKGAFSGADPSGKKGLIEEASEGTLFLDEVGDLSLAAQAKLLRFIEEGEYYRVGGTKKLHVKTRIVSATNKNLEDMIQKDFFREDLFYRLAVIKVEIPSLNERRDDIVPIARHFLIEFSKKHGKSFHGILRQTEELLKNYQWKGNIRELRNVIEKAVLISNGPYVTAQDLGFTEDTKSKTPSETVSELPPLPDKGIDLEALEKHYIETAFKKAKGNERKAAELLNMSYYSFRYRRKKLGI
jgi:DNA-binding NtrC family response regulator